jgi:putative glutamate/gamma-aminobutyrate antiporter
MINIAAICNIKNFPLMAEYGFSIIAFLILSSLFFFIPVSLISAELASGWPERGVYTWIREAFGPKSGFIGVWLQWITNVIWYPTILSFIAATFAYIFMPGLAQNKLFVLGTILITFWGCTLINFLGMRVSGWISTISALLGTILPIGLIILLSAFWVFTQHPIQIQLTWTALLPDFTSYHELVLLSGIFLGLCGMEMSAVHARDVIHPKTEYPKAIALSAGLIIILSALGALSIAAIVPHRELELTSGGMEAFTYLFQAFNAPWAIPLIACIMTIGALGMLSTWIVGPSRGLFATSKDGDLPPVFYKTNKQGMPIGIFITQGIIVSFLCLIFLYMPSVNSAYWILVAMASELYMIMYLMMFIAAIRLRRTHPNVKRAYQIPGGVAGMWIVASMGILGSSFAMIIGLFPPSQIEIGRVALYETILIGSIAFFCLLPFLFFFFRKPEWKRNL